MVWWLHDHWEAKVLFSGTYTFFHTFPLNCPSWLLELTLSYLHFRQQEGRRKIKSLLFKETICDILLVFLCSQWSHLFEEEGVKCNLYSVQLCTQLKMGPAGGGGRWTSILGEETRRDTEDGQHSRSRHHNLPLSLLQVCCFPFLFFSGPNTTPSPGDNLDPMLMSLFVTLPHFAWIISPWVLLFELATLLLKVFLYQLTPDHLTFPSLTYRTPWTCNTHWAPQAKLL